MNLDPAAALFLVPATTLAKLLGVSEGFLADFLVNPFAKLSVTRRAEGLDFKIVHPSFPFLRLAASSRLKLRLNRIRVGDIYTIRFFADDTVTANINGCEQDVELSDIPEIVAINDCFHGVLQTLACRLGKFLRERLPKAIHDKIVGRTRTVKVLTIFDTEKDVPPNTEVVYFNDVRPEFIYLGAALLQATANAMFSPTTPEDGSAAPAPEAAPSANAAVMPSNEKASSGEKVRDGPPDEWPEFEKE